MKVFGLIHGFGTHRVGLEGKTVTRDWRSLSYLWCRHPHALVPKQTSTGEPPSVTGRELEKLPKSQNIYLVLVRLTLSPTFSNLTLHSFNFFCHFRPLSATSTMSLANSIDQGASSWISAVTAFAVQGLYKPYFSGTYFFLRAHHKASRITQSYDFSKSTKTISRFLSATLNFSHNYIDESLKYYPFILD